VAKNQPIKLLLPLFQRSSIQYVNLHSTCLHLSVTDRVFGTSLAALHAHIKYNLTIALYRGILTDVIVYIFAHLHRA